MDSKGTIMVLPGTTWQIPLIKRVKEKGYQVLVVHPTKDGDALPLADIVEYADILNFDDCLAAAKKHQVKAIMSDECDIATPTLAYVSTKLGLPTQTEEMAALYTDKALMRDFSKAHGLPYPAYQVCKTLDEALDFFRSLGKKMVIKPIDANSSRGVFTIHNEEELKALFADSIKYSHHRKAVICEQFISGAEFSIDGILTPQGYYNLVISEKTQFSYNKNLDEFLYFSYNNPKYNYNRLREINRQFVEASDLPFGFTHAEYRYEDGEFYLLEIGARGGGAEISSHIVPAMTGVDNYSVLIDMFTGSPIEHPVKFDEGYESRCAVLKFFDTTEKGGVVKEVKGLDFLQNHPDVLSYKMNFKVGDRIQRPTDGGNRIGFYVACCKDAETLDKLMKEVDEKVVIEYE